METLLIPLAVKFVPIILPVLLTWVGARWDQLVRSKVKSGKLRDMLLHVDDAVFAAVKSVQQTYLDAIEAAMQDDGKLSHAEKQEALRRALETAKAMLPPEVLAILEGIYGNKLDAFLTAKIEAAVHDVKKGVHPAALDALRGRHPFAAVPGLTR